MRDGTISDIVEMWSARMIGEHLEQFPHNNATSVYFAMLTHAAHGLLASNKDDNPEADYFSLVSELLHDLRTSLYADNIARDGNCIDIAFGDAAYPEMVVGRPSRYPPRLMGDYWATDKWKRDFHAVFSRYFWDMKDYAHPAQMKKQDFLWDVAEVWVATAAVALVYYAERDRNRWLETAEMLRHYADRIEEDGLRSLSWVRWPRNRPVKSRS